MRIRCPITLAVLPIVVSLAACKDPGNVNVLHNPPSVTITMPSDGASVYQGSTVDFQALVSSDDPDLDYTEITHRWVTGNTTMCESTPVNADGTASCSFAFPAMGAQSVTVTVTDPRLDTGTASISLNVLENTAPTISVESPLDGTGFEPGSLIVLEAIVDDMETSSELLVVTVDSSIDGPLALNTPPSSDGTWSAATSALSAGEHLLALRVTDPAGQSGSDTVRVVINQRPGAPVVEIEPDPAPSGVELSAVIVTPAPDPEGDSLVYYYDWYVDGSLYSSSTNPSVPLGVTVRAEFWEVRVAADDGHGLGDEGIASITVENSPPQINSATLTPTSPGTDDDLVAAAQGWYDQDSDPERYRYQWTKNGVVDSAETTATYPSGKTERDDQFQVRITPFDAYEDGEALDSPTITIGNAAPTAPGVAVTPIQPQPGASLTCAVTAGSIDGDGDPFTYQFEWYLNGVRTNHTDAVLEGQYTDHGDVWECRVSATDGMSTGPYGSSSVTVRDTVAPDAPVVEAPAPYRNDTDLTLDGDCEATCALEFTCIDSTRTWTESDVCAADGTFSHDVTLLRGESTTCDVTCTDAAGNTSDPSVQVDTEVCDPYDVYEDDAGYGDTIDANVDLFPLLADDGGTTITIEGNALDYGDEDWFLVATSDDNVVNARQGQNNYNFEVMLTSGANAYAIQVLKASAVTSGYPSTAECPTMTDGYTEYSDYWVGFDGLSRSCTELNTEDEKICESMGEIYYIVVRRDPTVSLSCQGYELTITNGVW